MNPMNYFLGHTYLTPAPLCVSAFLVTILPTEPGMLAQICTVPRVQRWGDRSWHKKEVLVFWARNGRTSLGNSQGNIEQSSWD